VRDRNGFDANRAWERTWWGERRMRGTVAVIGALVASLAATLQAGEIHDAAAAGDSHKLKALLAADPSLLESKDDNGFTPLAKACFTKQVVVANLLLDKGANVNVTDYFRMTPLHRASYVSGQDVALLQRLLDKGADVNARGNNGLTPLHFAAYSGHLKVATFLIEHGADPNASDKYSGPIVTSSISGTVLQVAIRFRPDDEVAKFLVERGATLNKGDSSGNTELHLASLKGFADLVRVLVKHGGDVNAVNEHGRTALSYAAEHGYRRVADVLIAAGAQKSAIVEANYGKAPQLTAPLTEGEAYLWYLGGGYAVKTRGHLLLFNPEGIDESSEAGLANGHLNPNELTGLKITVLSTVPERFQYGRDAFALAQRMPGIHLAFRVTPSNGRLEQPDRSSYRLAAPNEHFSVDGLQVHTIPATAGGMGYLIEADGVKMLHAGFHVSDNDPSNLARYRKEVDFLKPADVGITSPTSVTGCGSVALLHRQATHRYTTQSTSQPDRAQTGSGW
jgi:ankyrin repeat protein